MTDAAGKQTQAGQASLGIAHLVKQYANADRPVLNDISFDVPHGKVFVIVGPSGSGKSTLLRTIAGLEPIQGGTISLNGEVIETGKPGTESAGRSKRSSEIRAKSSRRRSGFWNASALPTARIPGRTSFPAASVNAWPSAVR